MRDRPGDLEGPKTRCLGRPPWDGGAPMGHNGRLLEIEGTTGTAEGSASGSPSTVDTHGVSSGSGRKD
jgi:hypothetical protein